MARAKASLGCVRRDSIRSRTAEQQNSWRPVGAAWAHSEGEGFGLKLDYLPVGFANGSLRQTISPKLHARLSGKHNEISSIHKRSFASAARERYSTGV
jgi:hypothetical protein